MPESPACHAAPSMQTIQPSQMEPSRGPTRLLEEAAPQMPANKLFNTDDAAVALSSNETRGATKPLDKRGLDYLLRSGIAGGLAGCAVSRPKTPSADEMLIRTRQ